MNQAVVWGLDCWGEGQEWECGTNERLPQWSRSEMVKILIKGEHEMQRKW